MINLFSTPIKIISLNNFKEITNIISKCMSVGFKRNFNDGLPKDEAEQIEKVFRDEAELYLKELTNKKIDLELAKSWTVTSDKYDFNVPHEHMIVNVVCVYYIKTFDGCGDLLLHDPRGATNFVPRYEYIKQCNRMVDARMYHRITPKAGDLIIFPSYIVHSVEPNMSDEKRISLAMNFKYKDYEQFRE